LTEVVEVFAELLRKASGIPVHVGWRPASSFPTAVLQLRSAEINPLDMAASKHLVDVSLQLDIWHTSPKACDEAVDRIIQHLEGRGCVWLSSSASSASTSRAWWMWVTAGPSGGCCW
jgi:hypothetical protein